MSNGTIVIKEIPLKEDDPQPPPNNSLGRPHSLIQIYLISPGHRSRAAETVEYYHAIEHSCDVRSI